MEKEKQKEAKWEENKKKEVKGREGLRKRKTERLEKDAKSISERFFVHKTYEDDEVH